MNGLDQELLRAATANNVPEVRRLLSVGADVNAWDADDDDDTALHKASYFGHVQAIKELLDHGADIERTNKDGRTQLHWASGRGHLQVFQALREHGADVNAKDDEGETPLHFACCPGHLAVVEELLSPHDSNGTPTILGKRKSRGADIDATDNNGDTPLHTASLCGTFPVVKALLRGGADILAVNNQGKLPVQQAISKGHSAVSKYLLQKYYATTRRLPLHELLEDLTWIGNPDSCGVPPLRAALHQNVLRTDDVVEILEYLVGPNPELLCSRDRDGTLPLHVACRRGASFPIVQSLVKHYQASVKSVTPQGNLPLFLACDIPEPSLDTIFLLIKLYPDLVCCLPVVSIAKTIEEDLFSDDDALSQQAMLLEEIKQLKAKNAELNSELSAKDKKLEQIEGENADLRNRLHTCDNHF
jgi:ankyrin repeat protein